MAKRARRAERRAADIKKAVDAKNAAIDLQRRRREGRLDIPPGTTTEGGLRRGYVESRAGVAYTVYVNVPKFTPSTGTPNHNPARDLRRHYEPISGRQWRRKRKWLLWAVKAGMLTPDSVVSAVADYAASRGVGFGSKPTSYNPDPYTGYAEEVAKRAAENALPPAEETP